VSVFSAVCDRLLDHHRYCLVRQRQQTQNMVSRKKACGAEETMTKTDTQKINEDLYLPKSGSKRHDIVNTIKSTKIKMNL